MSDADTWQARAIERLSEHFKADPDARAFIVTGSLADTSVEEDLWSDVDVKVIMADHAVDRYYLSVAWLQPFGQIIGAERHEDRFTRTLRVCLEGFQRFDLVFVAESALEKPPAQDEDLFPPPCALVWSKVSDLEARMASRQPAPATYQEISEAEIDRMAESFWFKAAVAITKVMRNDLLIGLHLALDLVRDCLVLQMMRRDREKRTRVHRTGGWGNDLIDRFSWEQQEHSPLKILDIVAQSGALFDDLAADLSPGYRRRWPLLSPSLEAARETCNE